LIKSNIFNPIVKRIRYLLNTNHSIKLFLQGSSYIQCKDKYINQNKYAKVSTTNLLIRLNQHGYHFGLILKRKIIDYIGKECLLKERYNLYKMAAININKYFENKS
jgi:hypothetical protein